MELKNDGAELVAGALAERALDAIETALELLPRDRPGARISDVPQLRSLLAAKAPIGRVAARWLGHGCRPIRAILFDKSEQTNWALGWHQDRTIAVTTRVEEPGFGPWTIKSGVHHVEPPTDMLKRMVTLRVHLDPVDADNAPLLIAPGSHRHGRIVEAEIDTIVDRCGVHTCLAQRGDIWAYATLILHASETAGRPRRRRVLQVDYSSDELPSGLRFHGI